MEAVPPRGKSFSFCCRSSSWPVQGNYWSLVKRLLGIGNLPVSPKVIQQSADNGGCYLIIPDSYLHKSLPIDR
jgi:hypothetical protein